MPMTRADWNAWSPTKRKFYAELFACYIIADDGMLRIDTVKRRELVRDQLARQAVDGAESIITRTSAANYLIADGLQADGQTLKGAHEADRIRVLCSQRGDIATMRSVFPVPGQGEAEEDVLTTLARADEAAASREPIQHSVVGGFKSEDQTIPDHFVNVVRAKMLNGNRNAIPNAQLLSLGEIDDLSFFSRCALDPVEKLFLLEDPMFRDAIGAEARRLSSQIMKGKMSALDLEQRILEHINLCSAHKTNPKSLAGLSIPRVGTYLALYTTDQFNRLAAVAMDNLSIPTVGRPPVPGPIGFKGESKPLKRYLVDGLLEFTFPPEFRNFMKASFLLKGPFAGQLCEQIKDQTGSFVAQGDLVPTLTAMLIEISKEQIDNIKSGSLPVPPGDMGTMWDLRRAPGKILNILRNNQCLDLYTIAEMAGFSRENAHQAFGLQSRALVDAINKDIIQLWDIEAPALLRGVDKYLTQQEKDLKADWRGAGATLAHLKGDDVQISGVRLGMEPPKVVVAAPAVALAALGLFAAQPQPAAVAAGPQAAKTKAEIAREAAEARMAAKQAIVAAKKREEILAAAAAAPEAGAENDEDDDERARMRQA